MPDYAIIKDKIICLASNVTEIIPGRVELELVSPYLVEALLRLVDAGYSLTSSGRFDLEIKSGDSKSMETMQQLYTYKNCFIIKGLIDYPLQSLGGEPKYILVPVFYTEKLEMNDALRKH